MNFSILNKSNKLFYIIYKICLVTSISTILALCGEVIIRKDFYEMYHYFYVNIEAFILLILLLSSLITIFYCVFNNIGVSTILVGIPYFLGQTINYYKFAIKGEYVSPSDIRLISEAINISSKFNFYITPNIIWSAVCLVWIIALTLIIKEKINNKKERLYIVFISLTLFISLINTIKNNETVSKLGIEISMFNIKENYEDNGFLFTFINSLNSLDINEPENYSKNEVFKYLELSGLVNKEDIKSKPNIIIIMNEAFTDVTDLPDVHFSEDPISFFKSLQKEFTSGNAITPVFGGLTSQVEYQVLTGNSTYFTDVNNVVYLNCINKGFPSIVNVLNSIGYNSIAIHPYERNFYSRESVYKDLGFTDFISEEDFINPDRIRGYITDKELSRRIIEEYEKKQDNIPLFIHSISMQNHGPYDSGYNEANILLESEVLSEDNRAIVSEYANLLKRSDEGLEYLVEYFSNINEPTIILMFGDHKPILGDNMSTYKQLGVVGDTITYEQYYDIMHTPFVIWNNYGLTNEQYTDVDTSYLGAILLKIAGLNYDKYFNYLYNFAGDILAFNDKFYIDKNRNILSIANLNKESQDKLDDLWMLQYDRSFGKNYIEMVD